MPMNPKSQSSDPRELRILILAPTGRDAPLACAALAEAGMRALAVANAVQLIGELQEGAGAVVLTEEALGGDATDLLARFAAQQPPWSDLPIVVVTAPAHQAKNVLESLTFFGNVTLLDRPLRIVTLLAAVRTALRSRRRQYHMRDLLDQLQQGVRQRDRFLAMLGHELRNPLAAIRNAIQVLEAILPEDNIEVGEHRALMSRQTDHLARLLDDLLDVSRITAGKIVLRKQDVDLRELAQRCVKAVASQAQTHRHTILLHDPDCPVMTYGDQVRLEQILTNLLTNAVKYTPPGGRILITVKSEDPEAILTVEDNGIGMDDQTLPNVFEPFTQADHSLDRAQGGMGLGLAVVKNLVELHGGNVLARSEGLGRGSTFTVRLPLLIPKPQIARIPASAMGARPAIDGHPRHVLLVEDSEDSRRILGRLLQIWGHRVELAGDGRDGLQKALATRPEVALIDIGLPGIDGYELAREIRRQIGKSMALVALTGYGQPEDIQRTRDAGFDMHLVKPVDPPHLSRLLSHLFNTPDSTSPPESLAQPA